MATPDIVENFVSPKEEKKLISFLEDIEWTELKGKKVFTYGKKYSEKQEKFLVKEKIPKALKFLSERLVEDEIMEGGRSDRCNRIQ